MQSFSGMGGPPLPFPGSLLEQPDWFLDDYAKIEMRKYILEQEAAGSEA